MRLKVLHVLPTLDPRLGGPSSAVRGMSRSLAAAGLDVMIASTTTGEQWQAEGVPTFQARVAIPRLLPSSFYYAPELARWMERRIRDFDVVHVHTVFNFPSALACRLAKRHRVPYVVRPCGILDPWSLAQGRLKKRLWMRLIERANLEGAAAIHFTCEEERLAASGLIGTVPCIVTPLGVDVPSARRAEPSGPEKQILFLSRLHSKKGLERLVEALEKLHRERDDFVLVIAGRGKDAYERQLRRLVADAGLAARTRWCGFVEGAEKEQLLQRAAMFVLPSYQENFGIAVAEAMAYGIPVVISDRVNIQALVTENRAGIVVGSDGESLISAIRRLLDDPALRVQCGANAASAAVRHFSWDAIAQDLIGLYRRLRKGQPIPNSDMSEDG